MIRSVRVKLALSIALLAARSAIPASAQTVPTPPLPPPIRYTVSLANPELHLVHVILELPPGAAERDLQLPVWNSLYQVRDFSQYVNWVKAVDHDGRALPVRLIDKSHWRIGYTELGATVEYEATADQPSPYGAQLNPAHAFFNLAEILMYPPGVGSAPVQLTFTGLPAGWRIATALADDGPTKFSAETYDRMADSPVEIGTFREENFEADGSRYRVVVDAAPADYDMQKIVSVVRRIVTTEITWMDDRPFTTYLFIYHFPHVSNGGGMEHAYSTAIDVNARVLAENPLALPEVTAHEFFHLWNVKRIRPQSLEPIDYTKENYSPALWFSEGVTNTVQDYTLVRGGLLEQQTYLTRLADHIADLERRPAHLTQSVEQSSLDAWLEKYPAYRAPERSISYYDKGELLGVMLDLAVRDVSHGSASLREIFQWMNQNYARQGRFFPDSQGVEQAAEAVSHSDLRWFFQKYVAGTDEIPWDEFFRTVGLRLVQFQYTVADTGFWAARNFDAPPAVVWIEPRGEAQRAGLQLGDSILKINGEPASSDFQQKLGQQQPGDMLRLRVRNAEGERELQWKLGSRVGVEPALKDVENITPQQKARRTAWLRGEAQGDGSR